MVEEHAMTVIVEDYTRDARQTFPTRSEAETWLEVERGVTVFVPRADGAVDCWAPYANRSVARILLTHVNESDPSQSR